MVDDNEIELALEGDVPIYVHKKHIAVPKEVEEFEEPIYRIYWFECFLFRSPKLLTSNVLYPTAIKSSVIQLT